MTRRILVTGARGFVGRHLLPYVHNLGFEIHAVGRQPPDDCRVVFHRVDLLGDDDLVGTVHDIKASHLLHLAWNADPGCFWRSPDNLDWVCASLALLRSFHESGGSRAVFAGTCAEYRWGSNDRLDERESELAPATLYGAAKDALRRIALAYADASAISVAWGRLFFLYGPGEKRGRLVSDAICSLCSGRPFPAGDGYQRRDFMHVEDAARALAVLLMSEVRGAVNIASGEAVSIRFLLERIACKTGSPDLIQYGALKSATNEPAVIEAAVDRLIHEVGFAPQISLSDGLAQTVEWWREKMRAETEMRKRRAPSDGFT